MKKTKDLIALSKYYEIVCQLIFEKRISSLIKVIFISISIYNYEDYYEGSTKRYYLLNDIISAIRICLNRDSTHFCYVFDCLNLLKSAKMIEINDGLIKVIDYPNFVANNKLLKSPQIILSIEEVERYSDTALIKEIIEYV